MPQHVSRLGRRGAGVPARNRRVELGASGRQCCRARLSSRRRATGAPRGDGVLGGLLRRSGRMGEEHDWLVFIDRLDFPPMTPKARVAAIAAELRKGKPSKTFCSMLAGMIDGQ